jgi:prevent-host-death family protein
MSTAALPTLNSEPIERVPASEVKQRGWRGLMRTVQSQGTVIVTNHDRPEAVILGVEQYEALRRAASVGEQRVEAAVEDLARDFDKRLAALEQKDAGERLRAAMRKPAMLHGKVRAPRAQASRPKAPRPQKDS